MNRMRLDKYISSQGNVSRSDVKKLIRKGAVTVDGTVAVHPDMQIVPGTSSVFVSGQALDYKEHIYIMLNKPMGVVSATEDSEHQTVIDLIPEGLKRDGLFPAGRLDGDTTGFVLVTDDGEFAHKILSPKNHIQKTYVADLQREVAREDIAELEEGILLKDGTRCLPAKVFVISPNTVKIQICEGKYHQIKRMFAARGNKVVTLKRVAMGGLPLDKNLMPGQCREITLAELEVLEKGEIPSGDYVDF